MPRLSKPRVEPLDESEFDEETREALAPTRQLSGDKVFLIFRTLARHPKLLKRWLVFGNHVLGQSTLGAREREIAILRIGWLCRAEYEWAQHAVIGEMVGLTQEDIDRIIAGPDAPDWSPLDAAIVRAVDELHADAFVSDATWTQLSAELDEKQIIDLLFTVGQYNLVSMVLNTLGVQLDEGLKGFPKK